MALLAILVQVIGSVGGYLHFALIQHERCAEHGELIHAQAAGSGGSRSSEPRPVSATGDQAGLDSADPDEHEHDVCSALGSLRKRDLVAPPVSIVVAAVLSESHVTLFCSLGSPCERELYELAPKNSPPAHV